MTIEQTLSRVLAQAEPARRGPYYLFDRELLMAVVEAVYRAGQLGFLEPRTGGGCVARENVDID